MNCIWPSGRNFLLMAHTMNKPKKVKNINFFLNCTTPILSCCNGPYLLNLVDDPEKKMLICLQN